ncbi:MAG: restriction endonuclease [Bacteroidetes bacterium]|nr:restriction endonuclease [Bacteroidota bacterium]
MSKVDEAREILKQLGLPKTELAALTLLALCGLKERDKWKNATRKSLGLSKGIMAFVNENYGKSYAPNTRETFRKNALHEFVLAGIVDYNPDNPTLSINSPSAHYAISSYFVQVVKSFGTDKWEKEIDLFNTRQGRINEVTRKGKEIFQSSLILPNGEEVKLSAGQHNETQLAVVNEFLPFFAPGSVLLYIGDTADKNLYMDKDGLHKLNIPINIHSKLPDVIIFDPQKNWLFLVEVVASHGPMSLKRIKELNALLDKCPAGKIYVTAFPDLKEFKKHSQNIAWDTEVWIAEMPEHMIHFNGDRFLGPR